MIGGVRVPVDGLRVRVSQCDVALVAQCLADRADDASRLSGGARGSDDVLADQLADEARALRGVVRQLVGR